MLILKPSSLDSSSASASCKLCYLDLGQVTYPLCVSIAFFFLMPDLIYLLVLGNLIFD